MSNTDSITAIQPDRPSRSSSWAMWIVLIALAAGAGVAFYLRPAPEKPSEAPPPPAREESDSGKVKYLMEQQWLIRMKLARVEKRTMARQITATGRVVPAPGHLARISTPVAGLLGADGTLPQVGQRVHQGQALAVIQEVPTAAEQAQLQAAAAQVEAQNAQVRVQNSQIAVENARLRSDLATANGEIAAARVRRDFARIEAQRAERMYAQKAFSRRQWQAAQADYAAAQAVYLASQRRASALVTTRVPQVEPTSVRFQGPTTFPVRSPLSGYVIRQGKTPGEQVAAGETILEVLNLDVVYVEAPIFERNLGQLERCPGARFKTLAHPGREFSGTVQDVGAVVDPRTRTATVLFKVPNPRHVLRVGMQANVSLETGDRVTVMMIPKASVLEAEGKKVVYVLASGEEFERREVVTGDEYGDMVAVLGGLKAGERVVTQGAYQLRLQELRPGGAPAHSHET